MTPFRRSLALVALLPALALAASCGSSTPSESGDVLRAAVAVAVDPNPVVGTQNAVTFAVSAQYTITLTEIAGLGGEVALVNSSAYDPATGALIASTVYDSSDMTVFVGTKRIDAKGTLSFKHTVSYARVDANKAATLTVSVQFKDDRGNMTYSSILAPIQ
jgi:hypothetical protein